MYKHRLIAVRQVMEVGLWIGFAVISTGLIAWIAYHLESEAWHLYDAPSGPTMWRRINGKIEYREPTEEEMQDWIKSRTWLSPRWFRSPLE